MSISVNFHPVAFWAEQGVSRPDHVWIEIDAGGGSRAAIHLTTTAQCDDLIKAAVAAKSMLLGDTAPPALTQDLGLAEADPANSYGGTAKHGEFTAASAAEAAEGVEPIEGHVMCDDELLERQIKTVLGMTDNPIPMPTGHLPQHKGGHPECTLCDEPGHHLHAIEVPTRGEL